MFKLLFLLICIPFIPIICLSFSLFHCFLLPFCSYKECSIHCSVLPFYRIYFLLKSINLWEMSCSLLTTGLQASAVFLADILSISSNSLLLLPPLLSHLHTLHICSSVCSAASCSTSHWQTDYHIFRDFKHAPSQSAPWKRAREQPWISHQISCVFLFYLLSPGPFAVFSPLAQVFSAPFGSPIYLSLQSFHILLLSCLVCLIVCSSLLCIHPKILLYTYILPTQESDRILQ